MTKYEDLAHPSFEWRCACEIGAVEQQRRGLQGHQSSFMAYVLPLCKYSSWATLGSLHIRAPAVQARIASACVLINKYNLNNLNPANRIPMDPAWMFT